MILVILAMEISSHDMPLFSGKSSGKVRKAGSEKYSIFLASVVLVKVMREVKTRSARPWKCAADFFCTRKIGQEKLPLDLFVINSTEFYNILQWFGQRTRLINTWFRLKETVRVHMR